MTLNVIKRRFNETSPMFERQVACGEMCLSQLLLLSNWKIFRLNFDRSSQQSVWLDLAKFRHFGKILHVFGVIFKNLNYYFSNF